MKEPKIMRMDWKSLGYEREYKDGKLQWVPIKNYNNTENNTNA